MNLRFILHSVVIYFRACVRERLNEVEFLKGKIDISLSISKIINEGFSHAFDFLGRSCIYFRLLNQQVSFFTVR